jgi:hypothetical protein
VGSSLWSGSCLFSRGGGEGAVLQVDTFTAGWYSPHHRCCFGLAQEASRVRAFTLHPRDDPG